MNMYQYLKFTPVYQARCINTAHKKKNHKKLLEKINSCLQTK